MAIHFTKKEVEPVPDIQTEIEMFHEIRETMELIRARELENLDVAALSVALGSLLETYSSLQFGQTGIDRLVKKSI